MDWEGELPGCMTKKTVSTTTFREEVGSISLQDNLVNWQHLDHSYQVMSVGEGDEGGDANHTVGEPVQPGLADRPGVIPAVPLITEKYIQ